MLEKGPAPLEAGTVLGRYMILRCLGTGGMGTVFAARDRDLDREVALKLLHDPAALSLSSDALLREASAMARISDPAVVHVYEIDIVDGRTFVAMELIDGVTLREWCKEPRTWQEVTRVMLVAGRGLTAAHCAGVVHRDVKPENVLIGGNGRVCVVDFGLARRLPDADAASGATSAARAAPVSSCAGTPAYMAPEQHLGRDVTPASDQFGFCVTFWEALLGRHPFGAARGGELSTAPALALAIINQQIDDARDHAGVPRSLLAVLRRGLAIDPAQRWPDMSALLAEVERELDRPARRRRLAGVALLGGLVTALGAALALRGPDPLPFSYDRATRLTFAASCEEQPALLPDGRSVVYAQTVGQASTLHLVEPGGEDRVLGPGSAPAVSPGGRYLAALDRGQVALRDLQRPDAPARALGSSKCGPAWLNEREVIVGVDRSVVARPIDGGPDRLLGRVPEGSSPRAVTTGRDGRVFVVYRADTLIAESMVAEVLADGALRRLRRGVHASAGIRYRPDGHRLYYVQRMNSTQYHLFVQSADAEVEPTPMTSDLPPTGGFDVTPDGHHLAFSDCAAAASLVALHRDGTTSDVTLRRKWRDNAPRRIDAARLVYTSTRGGELQIWLRDGAEADDRALTAPESAYPALSPDRATLAYIAFQDRVSRLMLRPLGGPVAARAVTEGHLDRAPAFTHDGQALLFLRETPAGMRLHRVAIAGGAATELLPQQVRGFDVSPADGAIAMSTPAGDHDKLQIVAGAAGAAGAGSAITVRDLACCEAPGRQIRSVRFSRDGRALLVTGSDGALLEHELASGTTRVRWRAEGVFTGAGDIDYDVDGQTVIASMIRSDGDLWLAEGRF